MKIKQFLKFGKDKSKNKIFNFKELLDQNYTILQLASIYGANQLDKYSVDLLHKDLFFGTGLKPFYNDVVIRQALITDLSKIVLSRNLFI